LAAATLVGCNASALPGPGAQHPSIADIAQIQMIDAQHGWAFGQRLIARTSDGANTFRAVIPHALSGSKQLDRPFFLDAMHAWVFVIEWNQSTLSTATLERTANGGATWSETSMKPAIDGALAFIDPKHGSLVTEEDTASHEAMTQTVWRTDDSGQTWSTVYQATYKKAIQPNAQRGDCSFAEITWTSPSHGLAGINCPTDSPAALEVTETGGSTWTRVSIPELPPQPGVALFSNVGSIHEFSSGELAAVVSRCVGSDGSSCSNYGELYHSVDGGVTWTQGTVIWAATDAVMSDVNHAWLPYACMTDQCATPGLLVTANGGEAWQSFALPQPFWPNMHGNQSFSLATPLLGFGVVTGEFQIPGFYKTVDGGHTFETFTPRITV
jgi:photosystem II stability/assembly factor-like uncharacterized protein